MMFPASFKITPALKGMFLICITEKNPCLFYSFTYVPLQTQKGRQLFWVSAPSKEILILVSFSHWAPPVCKPRALLAKNLPWSGCAFLRLYIAWASLALFVTNSYTKVLQDGSKLVWSQFFLILWETKWENVFIFEEEASIIPQQTYRSHQNHYSLNSTEQRFAA